jgi:hypothetical protein
LKDDKESELNVIEAEQVNDGTWGWCEYEHNTDT